MRRCDYCGRAPVFRSSSRWLVRGRYLLCSVCAFKQIRFMQRKPGVSPQNLGYEMISAFSQD